MGGKKTTKADLEAEVKSFESAANSWQGELDDARADADRVGVKLDASKATVEKLYRALVAAKVERDSLKESCAKWQKTFQDRGQRRAILDPIYAVFRDACIEATVAGKDPVLSEIVRHIENTIPDGSVNAYCRVRDLFVEFGFETRGNYPAYGVAK